MKKKYEEPLIIIDLFPRQDIIVCSIIDEETPGIDDPIIVGTNGVAGGDTAP